MIPVVAPDFGSPPVQNIAVSCWLAREGDVVVEGDRLVELILNEITFDVACPASGKLASIAVETDEPVSPGDVLAYVEPERIEE